MKLPGSVGALKRIDDRSAFKTPEPGRRILVFRAYPLDKPPVGTDGCGRGGRLGLKLRLHEGPPSIAVNDQSGLLLSEAGRTITNLQMFCTKDFMRGICGSW